jgi:hypothetical protein
MATIQAEAIRAKVQIADQYDGPPRWKGPASNRAFRAVCFNRRPTRGGSAVHMVSPRRRAASNWHPQHPHPPARFRRGQILSRHRGKILHRLCRRRLCHRRPGQKPRSAQTQWRHPLWLRRSTTTSARTWLSLHTSEFSGRSLTHFLGPTNSVLCAGHSRPQCNKLDRDASLMPSIDRQLVR